MTAAIPGLNLLVSRWGKEGGGIERVQQDRAQRKTWQERHAWIDGLLREQPDVTVGENVKRKGS